MTCISRYSAKVAKSCCLIGKWYLSRKAKPCYLSSSFFVVSCHLLQLLIWVIGLFYLALILKLPKEIFSLSPCRLAYFQVFWLCQIVENYLNPFSFDKSLLLAFELFFKALQLSHQLLKSQVWNLLQISKANPLEWFHSSKVSIFYRCQVHWSFIQSQTKPLGIWHDFLKVFFQAPQLSFDTSRPQSLSLC